MGHELKKKKFAAADIRLARVPFADRWVKHFQTHICVSKWMSRNFLELFTALSCFLSMTMDYVSQVLVISYFFVASNRER